MSLKMLPESQTKHVNTQSAGTIAWLHNGFR